MLHLRSASPDRRVRRTNVAPAIALCALALGAVAQAAEPTLPAATPAPTAPAEAAADDAAPEPPTFHLDAMEVIGESSNPLGPVDGFVAYDSMTATKTDTPIIETPQSISVVTRDQIMAQNAQTVVEALLYTSNVTAEPYGTDARYDWVYIRGFNQAENGLFIDGLRQQSGGTGFRVDPYGLERIEVLRGPASVLYGQSTPGGIINQVSKRPLRTPRYDLELEFGSFDRYEAAFDLTGPIGDSDWSYRVNSLLRKSDTQVDFVTDNRAWVAPSFAWQPSPDTNVTFLTSFLYDDAGVLQYLPPQGTVQGNPNGHIPRSRFIGEPDFDSVERVQVFAGWAASHRFDEVWSARQNLRFGWSDFNVRGVYGNGLEPDLVTLRRIAFSEDHEAVNFAMDNQAEAKWALGSVTGSTLFGLDLSVFKDDELVELGFANPINVFNPVYGQQPVVTNVKTNDSIAVQTQLGLYVQSQAKLFERWVWVLGGRYDWVTNDVRDQITDSDVDQKPHEATWRIGTVYLFDNGIAPYGTYATSFDPIPNTNLFGEPFQPTTGELGEIGVKYEPPGLGAFVTASLFTITQDNVLTADPDNPLNQVQLGQVRSRGAEIEGVATLADGLSLLASYSFTDIETTKSTNPDDIGKRPVVVPEQLASGWIDYTQQWGMLAGLGGGVGVRYVGSSFGNALNTFKVPGYTLVDAAIRYETGPWRVTLNVSNLADETFATCSTDVACFYGQERTLIGTVRYRF